jgi:NurA domain
LAGLWESAFGITGGLGYNLIRKSVREAGVALELNKLTGQVAAMGQAMAARAQDHNLRAERARTLLRTHAAVTDELRAKIKQASQSDEWRRGASPLGDSLNERRRPTVAHRPATLIAVDGSQIYPDRHGIALYYLLNTGSIVLRQGSGQAPTVTSVPEVFYGDDDLYDELGRLRDPDYINGRRDRREIETLADLAEAERAVLGGDLSRPLVTLSDGPLLLWTPKPVSDRETAREIHYFVEQLDRLRRTRAVPIGYIDRPSSAYVLRILELIGLPIEQINRESLRRGEFLYLTDQTLFEDLEPNERTGLFVAASEISAAYERAGHRIVFFYLNVARPEDRQPIIARVEVPEWAANTEVLDLAQQAVYEDCKVTGFPYVLARAHELAVVGGSEQADLKGMITQHMLRSGLRPMISTKAWQKTLMRGDPA